MNGLGNPSEPVRDPGYTHPGLRQSGGPIAKELTAQARLWEERFERLMASDNRPMTTDDVPSYNQGYAQGMARGYREAARIALNGSREP